MTAGDGRKHESFYVKTVENIIERRVAAAVAVVVHIDVFRSISLFSEQLHECLGMPDPASVLFRLELEHNIFFRDEAR